MTQTASTANNAGATPSAEQTRLKVVSQAFRYCDYGAGKSMTRVLRPNAKPIQFLVNTWCDNSLLEKEVEIAVEIRDRQSQEPIFETFWVTTLSYERQQSAFIFREFPEELQTLEVNQIYTYYASALVNDTDDFAERVTRAVVK